MLYFSRLHGVNAHDSPLFEATFEQFVASLKTINILLEPTTLVNLDPAFDSVNNHLICQLNGCIPNIRINPRNTNKESKAPDHDMYKERFVNERAFAWEDFYRRLVIRYEVKAANYLAFCNMAAALILIRLIRT
jgi:hypothetical protein